MQIGLSVYDVDGQELVELAKAADRLGFGSLWLGEHIVLPVGYSSDHPTSGTSAGQHRVGPIVDPATKLLDPLVALAACSAVTEQIRLATGVFVVSLRSPLVAARMAHTVQQVSGGRLILGVGSGWLQEEFEAVGVPFAARGRRLVESVEIMRRAWASGPFSHDGEFFRMQEIQLCSEPTQVPVIMGGNSDAALRRAARLGDGWFASGTPDFDEAGLLRDRVLRYRSESATAEPFTLCVRATAPDPSTVDRYRDNGWDHVLIWADQVWPAGRDLQNKQASLAAAAEALGVSPGAP